MEIRGIDAAIDWRSDKHEGTRVLSASCLFRSESAKCILACTGPVRGPMLNSTGLEQLCSGQNDRKLYALKSGSSKGKEQAVKHLSLALWTKMLSKRSPRRVPYLVHRLWDSRDRFVL